MNEVSITELKNRDILPLLPLIKIENYGLIDTAINRALDARKISGGGSNSGPIILNDPTHCGPLPGPEFS